MREALDEQMFDVGGDFAKSRDLAAERDAATRQIEALFSEWEGLEG